MLDNTRGNVDVPDILVGHGVPNEDAVKMMVVQFSAPLTSLLDTDARPEDTEMPGVRLLMKPSFKWCDLGYCVYSTVVEICRVE